MYFLNVKNPIHKKLFITGVKLLKIRVYLAHGKHIGLGELHHRLQKEHVQLTNIQLQSILLQISRSATRLLEMKLLIMIKTQKNVPENHFKHFLEIFHRYCKVKEIVLYVNIQLLFFWGQVLMVL